MSNSGAAPFIGGASLLPLSFAEVGRAAALVSPCTTASRESLAPWKKNSSMIAAVAM